VSRRDALKETLEEAVADRKGRIVSNAAFSMSGARRDGWDGHLPAPEN
jgi:hypothetical protein